MNVRLCVGNECANRNQSNFEPNAIMLPLGAGRHPLSPESIKWVTSMLENCLGSNHRCPSTLASPFPARILALNALGPGEQDVIDVKLVQDKLFPGKYAALSHCWGLSLTCTTTKRNLKERMAGIPWSQLPKTFQDAIRYCLRLGISYLWIDALCIIQDSPDDWQVHSSKMADVYQNAFITLAATSAADGSVGCFPHQAVPQAGWRATFQPTPNETFEVLIRRELAHQWVLNTNTRVQNPLLSRAWAFQERLLSPRVLHFCKEELVWECAEGTVCECGSMPCVPNLKDLFAFAARTQKAEDDLMFIGRLGLLLSRRYVQRSGGQVQRTQHAQGSNQGPLVMVNHEDGGSTRIRIIEGQTRQLTAKDLAIHQWHGIVQQFSALELTNQSDRLPALSGIAERMQPYLGTFVAGLWTLSILQDLLWRVDERLDDRLHPLNDDRYHGPSWSWVSARKSVSFLKPLRSPPRQTIPPGVIGLPLLTLEEDDRSARVKSYDIRVIGRNPYGQVSSAKIVVEGYIQSVPLSRYGAQWRITLHTQAYSADRYHTVTGRSGQSEFSFSKDDHSADTKLDKVLLLMIRPNIFLVLRLKFRCKCDPGYDKMGRWEVPSVWKCGCDWLYERIGLWEVPSAWRRHVNVMGGFSKRGVTLV